MVPNSAGVMVNVISWGLSGPAGIEEELTNFRCRLDGQNTHICEYTVNVSLCVYLNV